MMEEAGILYEKLKERGYTLSTVESLTAGLIASTIAEVPGVSAVFKGGLVTYSNEMKHTLCGVREDTLTKYGAISEETAREMCLGGAERTGTDLCVSATGNAGPTGDEGKEVGLVYIGVALHGDCTVHEFHFTGSRGEIRRASADAAIRCLLEALQK